MKKNIFWVIIPILVLVLLLGGYFIYSNINKTEINGNNTANSVKKIDSAKEFVYGITYKEARCNSFTDSTTYSNEFGETFYIKDYNLPFINIESSDATLSNNEIELSFRKNICSIFDGKNKHSTISKYEYNYYLNDNTLSLLNTYNVGDTGPVSDNYLTYNFNLSTGKLYTFAQLCEKYGFTKEKIKKALISFYEKKWELIDKESYNNYYSNLKKETFEKYDGLVKSNSLQFALNDKKELLIVFNCFLPEEPKEHTYLVNIKK